MRKKFRYYRAVTVVSSSADKDVYLGQTINRDANPVLIKVFHADRLQTWARQEDFLQERVRFSSLRHRFIAPVLYIGLEEGQPYVVRNFVEGVSLRALLNRLAPGHVPVHDALRIILQVSQAISYTHICGMVHNNIKPENIFLTEKQEAIVTDFWHDRLFVQTERSYQGYAVPARFVGHGSQQMDLFLLGSLACELLSGSRPFGRPEQIGDDCIDGKCYEQEILRVLAELTSTLPESIARVVVKALAVDADTGYHSVQEFIEDIQLASITAGIVSLRDPLGEKFETQKSKSIILVDDAPNLIGRPGEKSLSLWHSDNGRVAGASKRWRYGLIAAIMFLCISVALISAPYFSALKIVDRQEVPTKTPTVVAPGTAAPSTPVVSSTPVAPGSGIGNVPAQPPTGVSGVPTPTASITATSPPVAQPILQTLKAQFGVYDRTTNLSQVGSMDWVDWSMMGQNHKRSAPAMIGSLNIDGQITHSGRPMGNMLYWSDGTPFSRGIDMSGVEVGSNVGSNVSFTVSSDTQVHTFYVYLGAIQARGRLTILFNGKIVYYKSYDGVTEAQWGQNARATIHYSTNRPDHITIEYTITKTYGSGSCLLVEAGALE